jgi:hypothetical protein
MNDNERIIDKIRKLIRHEESARKCSTPEEAAAFAARIQRLLFSHKIKMSDIDLGDSEESDAGLGEERVATGRGFRYGRGARVRTEDNILMSAVAEAHFCEAIILRDSNVIFIIGGEADRAVTAAMFRFLCSTMTQQSRLAKMRAQKFRLSVRRFDSYFAAGFVTAVRRRYKEMRAVNDCAVLIRSDQLVKAYVNEKYQPNPAPKTRKHKGRINRNGYFAGVAAGHQVDLGTNVLGGQSNDNRLHR